MLNCEEHVLCFRNIDFNYGNDNYNGYDGSNDDCGNDDNYGYNSNYSKHGNPND